MCGVNRYRLYRLIVAKCLVLFQSGNQGEKRGDSTDRSQILSLLGETGVTEPYQAELDLSSIIHLTSWFSSSV